MKALLMREYGGPEVLEIADLPIPEPGPGMVQVKVEAGGVNYSDIMIRHNRYMEKMSLPYVFGRELAGEVTAIGEGVTRHNVGDRVVGTAGSGAFAEYAVISEKAAYPVPDGFDLEHALAMLVQGITAIHCLVDVGGLQAGERVLIHAAAGGVGTLAVQLAKHYGAEVYGTASNDDKCQLIADLGGTPINYSDENWPQTLMDMTNGEGADLILESVGGETFKRSFREALGEFGRMVVLGSASNEVAKITNVEILGSGKTIAGYFLPRFFHPKRIHRVREASTELATLVANGTLKPIIGNTFSLDEAIEAFNHIESRASVGKIIIKP